MLFRRYLKPFSERLIAIFRDYPLPDFLIIGAQKCGTTSLYAYLMQHPGILQPKTKEIHYFERTKNYSRGDAWYRRHFPSESLRKSWKIKLGYSPITGEATPCMEHPNVPKLVHELLPNVKLIVLLRNPVDRAFSQYHHNRKVPGREPLTFEEAIAESAKTLSHEEPKDERRLGQPKRRNYLIRGLYAEHLEYWFKYYPEESLHIVNSEEFFADPGSEVKRVLRFLEMPDFNIDCSVPRHVGDYDTQMSQKMRECLEDFYRPHNRKLYELTQKNFGWPS